MDAGLFMPFAEIAGVFVGFGALISVRSTRLTDLHDVVYHQAVLGLGVWVVIAALVPIALNQYGVDDHGLWLTCAVIAIAIWATFMFFFSRSTDTRAINRSTEPLDRLFPIVGLPLHLLIAGSMVLIIIGVWPGLDEALYVTALTAGVIFAGYTLLALVLSQKHPPAPGRDGG